MKTSAKQTFGPASRASLTLWAPAASLLVPVAAFAQANACDQLKVTLAARIEATGVRGYSLEVVPASTPAPAGAKAIGNCEGGARKVLYRRWGGGSPAADVGGAAVPAPPVAAPASPVAAPELSPRRPPTVRQDTAAPAPVASVAAQPPAPAPNVPAAAARTSAPAPAPTPAPAAALNPNPTRTPEAGVGNVAVPQASVLGSAPVALDTPAEPLAAQAPLSQRIVEFVAANKRWLLVLLLVPLGVLGWAWRAHHLAYDKNGLPRGPRL